MTNQFKLLILDLDGVLVDTQWAENEALRLLGVRMGVQLTPDQVHEHFDGRRLSEGIERLAARSCQPALPDAIQWVRATVEDLLSRSGKGIQILGASEALTKVDIPLCVASNSPREIIDSRLKQAKLDAIIGSSIVSAYDTGHWKPDPTLFMRAAREHNVSPQECLVVEDSAVGVTAGVAAGMTVLHYVGDTEEAVAPHNPDITPFHSMEDLPRLVRERCEAAGGARP